MFTYAGPVEEGPVLDQPPVMVSLATPTPEITQAPYLTGEESFAPSTPLPAALPPGWPTAPSNRVTTRVVVRDLALNLAVIPQGDEDYPYCGVAQYLLRLGQPGGGRATYLYAHARAGMFLPILDASKIRNGQKMLGMIVDAYTSDDLNFRYEIVQVRRHQVSLGDAFAVATEQLWLQTSEGPRGTPGKTQVIARPHSIGPANPADAHPVARPRACD